MSWFKHLSVRTKLFMSYSSLLLLMGIMSAVAVWELACLNHNCVQIGTNWMPATDAANCVNTDAANHRIKERRYMMATTEADWKEQESQFAKLEKEVGEHLALLDKLCASQEERQVLDDIGVVWNDYLKQSAAIQALTRQGKKEEAESLMSGISMDIYTKLSESLEKELALNVNGGKTEVEQAAASYSSGWMIVLIVFGVNILLGLGLAAWVSRWFTHAVLAVDEIADSVATASQELAAASEQLSSGAQQSASSLEETASSLEEITATVRQNADNADQANQLASNSRATAEKGGAVVAQAVTAMGEINQASRKIADIITTIDEIAFQTNLLALNAAVEAARAGEQGRGFAVVAGEVRNLAQRSATAAREIKGLIEDSVQKVETGSDLVNKSGETLEAIVTSVKRVTDIVGEIAAASREQTVGIEQINKAVAQMDQVTQSNASQTEEMSGTAIALSGQAEQLQTVVAQFNLKRRTSSHAASASSHSAPVIDSRPVSRTARRRSTPAKAKRRAEEHELVATAAGSDGFEEF